MPELQSNYSEFFTVDESYYPEINPDSIKGDIDGWMKTWPHPTFIELLEKTERMLAREARGKKHCIWVQGAFGTGKSRVIWTIKELLGCSEVGAAATCRLKQNVLEKCCWMFRLHPVSLLSC